MLRSARLWSIALWITLLMPVAASAAREQGAGGIQLDVTRVIFSQQDKNGVTLKIHNKSDKVFLLQSTFKPVDISTGLTSDKAAKNNPMPFIVTPPLSRLEAHSELILRIRRNGAPLPTDRESVYFISIKAVPAQPRKATANFIAMAVVTNLKVFYRPNPLSQRAIADIAPTVRFSRRGPFLIAKNPSAYWLTFASLKVGDYVFDNDALRFMVPPYGERQYRLPDNRIGDVEWQLTDEESWKTGAQKQTL